LQQQSVFRFRGGSLGCLVLLVVVAIVVASRSGHRLRLRVHRLAIGSVGTVAAGFRGLGSCISFVPS
jgi:hypothetical protein